MSPIREADTPGPPAALPSETRDQELRRRLAQLMLFRVVLISFVLGTTIAINLASPEELASAGAVWLFGIVGVTFLLTLMYALTLRRQGEPRRLAYLQIAGDLVVTTALVHLSGGVQSAYSLFYLMSILGAALIHGRRGPMVAAAASLALFTAISLLGWYHVLPVPAGQRLLPWDIGLASLIRQLALNGAAFAAIAFLSSKLGEQLASAGARLETQAVRSADLAAQSADVIRCLSSGLVTVDLEGRVLAFNEAAAEITGVTATTTRNRPIADVMPELAALLTHADAARGVRREMLSFTRDGQERTLGVSVSPLTDHMNNPVGRIANFSDLTELRRMEHQVKRAERLAAVGQMAAGVAHEIRNPLASISGSIELLRATPSLDPDADALMGIALREVDRLNAMITDLLEYASPRPRAPVLLELAALLDETVRVFAQDRSSPATTVRFEAAFEASQVTVLADPGQIRQVLWNLLRNAAEAMPGGGPILVTLRRLRADAAADDAEWIEFAVADQGGGISPGDQERMFEPFFTTKSRGSGLGLATVHRIVTEHAGVIAVDSTPGSGTRIAIRLLITPPPLRAPSPGAYTPGRR